MTRNSPTGDAAGQPEAASFPDIRLHDLPLRLRAGLDSGKAHQFVGDKVNSTDDELEAVNVIPIPGVQMLPAKHMEAACAQCHASYSPTTFKITYLPQMTTIARGEQLFQQQACYGCHKIAGFSKGNIGPELTYEGRQKPIKGHRAPAVGSALSGRDVCYALLLLHSPAQYGQCAGGNRNGRPACENDCARVRAGRALAGLRRETGPHPASARLHSRCFPAGRCGRPRDVYRVADGPELCGLAGVALHDGGSLQHGSAAGCPGNGGAGQSAVRVVGLLCLPYIGDPNTAHVTGDPKHGQAASLARNSRGKGHATPKNGWWPIIRIRRSSCREASCPSSVLDSQRAALSLYDQSLRPAKVGARTVSPIRT